MKKRQVMSSILILGTLSGAAVSCGDSKGAGGAGAAAGGNAVNVRVETLQPADFSETIHLTGIVKAIEDVTVSPEEGGTLKEWTCEKGRYVERGTIIALLDDGVVKAGYDAALAQYNTAELVYGNQQRVFSEQAISETQLKTSGYARDAAKAQADLMKARFERTRVRAPVSGILDERLVDVGELAPPGLPLARIVNLSAVKIVINVPERYAGQLQKGTMVEFSVIAYPGLVFRGRVSFVGSAISPDNRTFPVEAELANPGGKLKPEMIARATIMQASRKQALLVREEIVQQVDRDRQIVYVEDGGTARERRVQLGGRSGNTVEVVAGLRAGDRIITSGFQKVVDGQPVTIAPVK
jgi:membrane fusion protein (multidrug efflux system)